MISRVLFEALFVVAFCLSFLILFPQNFLFLGLPLIAGLGVAYFLQKSLKAAAPPTSENELDDSSFEPSFWVVFGTRMSPSLCSKEENAFLSFVASKRLLFRLAHPLIFLWVLGLSGLGPNVSRPFSFWINLLMVVCFAKAITSFHYWLCLFLNIVSVLLFWASHNPDSYFLLFGYVTVVCFIFVQAKLKLSVETFQFSEPVSDRTLLKGLFNSVGLAIIILLLGFCFDSLLPNPQKNQIKKKAHQLNLALGKKLRPGKSGSMPADWVRSALSTREVGGVEWDKTESQIDKLRRDIAEGEELSASKEAALKGLEKVRTGEEPSFEEVAALQNEIENLKQKLKTPQKPAHNSSEALSGLFKLKNRENLSPKETEAIDKELGELIKRMRAPGKLTDQDQNALRQMIEHKAEEGLRSNQSALNALRKLEGGEEPSNEELAALQNETSQSLSRSKDFSRLSNQKKESLSAELQRKIETSTLSRQRALQAIDNMRSLDGPSEQNTEELEQNMHDLKMKLQSPGSLTQDERNTLTEVLETTLTREPSRETLGETRVHSMKKQSELSQMIQRELSNEGPEKLTPSERSTLEQALEREGTFLNQQDRKNAADILSKRIDPTTLSPRAPLIAPKLLNKLFSFLKFVGWVLGVFFVILVLRKLFKKIDPEKEEAEKEEKWKWNEIQDCLDELEFLKRKKLSAREEIIAYYQLFLKMMSITQIPRPDFLPAESYSKKLEARFPNLKDSLRLTSKCFSRAFYSLLHVSDEDLESFRSHIPLLLKLSSDFKF